MVAFQLVCLEHHSEVAETLTTVQLAEHQSQQLMPAAEMLHVNVAIVLVNQSSELVIVEKSTKLCEHVFVFVHL